MIINLPKSLTLSHSGPAKICGNRRPTFRAADCVLITQAREMPEDKELRRLKEVERLARERFLRLSLPGTFGGDADVIKAAEALWNDAAAAMRAHRDK